MAYRTRTYIAADWDNDKDAVDMLYKWNEDNSLALSFVDAHELSECRNDDTNNCNIKKNCSQNLDHSKDFVLIIGKKTKHLRAGYCMYCKDYKTCKYTYKTDKSFIEFECDYAVRNKLPIIVLYNSWNVDMSLCIDSVVYRAICHVPMKKLVGKNYWAWDYQMVKFAFDKLNKK